jgi:predicted dehydrogenase
LRAECEHFLDCILDGVEPRSGGEFARRVVETLEAIDRSMGKGGQEEMV